MTERSVVAKALEDEGTLSKEEILAVEERVQDLQAK